MWDAAHLGCQSFRWAEDPAIYTITGLIACFQLLIDRATYEKEQLAATTAPKHSCSVKAELNEKYLQDSIHGFCFINWTKLYKYLTWGKNKNYWMISIKPHTINSQICLLCRQAVKVKGKKTLQLANGKYRSYSKEMKIMGSNNSICERCFA